jgi:TRAP-type C4-dicarboxylate transport system permease small subunit
MKQRTYTKLDIVAAWYLAFAIPMALLNVVLMATDLVDYSPISLLLLAPILLALPVMLVWLVLAVIIRLWRAVRKQPTG